jgi:AcrR family transcriptional regulator
MIGKREQRKRATRGELIQAGRRLFSQKGLYESRIEDLATEAGIAKGTLYTYFADKDELIREVAAAGFGELETRVARRVDRMRGDRGVVREAIRAHLQFFAANPDLMRVLHQVRGNEPLRGSPGPGSLRGSPHWTIAGRETAGAGEAGLRRHLWGRIRQRDEPTACGASFGYRRDRRRHDVHGPVIRVIS